MSTCLDTPLHSSMGSWDRALTGWHKALQSTKRRGT